MIHAFIILAASVGSGCAPHEQLFEQLGRAGYAVIGAGPIGGGQLLMEIYVDEAGNWVAVLTSAADRLSCVKAMGTDWRSSATGEAA
jgi:hypothetical protein